MNRRDLIRTVTLGAAGAVFTGTLPGAGLTEAPKLTTQLAGLEAWYSMSQALRLAFANQPDILALYPVAGETLDLCARQLDVSERSRAQTGICSADNLTVVFDRTDLMNVQLQIHVRAVVPVGELKVNVVIAP